MGTMILPHPGDAGGILEYGTAGWTRTGMTESGDRHAVIPHPRGLLIAVVDGLGHGHEAAIAAAMAIATLTAQPGLPVTRLMERCHEALRHTRGAVMSLASLDSHDQSMTWIGVGNVEGMLVRAGATDRKHILMRGGIVGHRLPRLLAATVPLHTGDLLIFATDGIRSGYERDINPHARPQEVADQFLLRYGVSTDDALVLVGRWQANSAASGTGRTS
jgi:negative regulator of sigma-B (phosphoserine phosphatase)